MSLPSCLGYPTQGTISPLICNLLPSQTPSQVSYSHPTSLDPTTLTGLLLPYKYNPLLRRVLDVGILTAPADTKVKAGDAATFSCDVTKEEGYIPTVSWFKAENNALVAEDGVRTITVTQNDKSTLSVLVLLKIEVSNKGKS